MGTRAGTDDTIWDLLEGERFIWSGRPRLGMFLTRHDILLIPFSLMWGGFAIFWENSVLRTNAPLIFRLWGIPFVLAGLYFTVGRFVVDAWLRDKTRYAVTNRRILIARSGVWGNLTALSLDLLPEVQLSPQANGRGTLRFGPSSASQWAWSGRGGFASMSPALDPTPQFIGIEDAQDVFNQIQRAIRSGRSDIELR
jgi:hypothetical protein